MNILFSLGPLIRERFAVFTIYVQNISNNSTWTAQTSAKGAHILKISSKSVHNFLGYLSKNYISWIQKIQIVIRITPKIEPFLPCTFADISWKFHQNPSISFWVILLPNKLTNPQTNPGKNITSLAEVTMWPINVSFIYYISLERHFYSASASFLLN